MSNQAYLGVWYPELPEGLLLERFGAFLGTVPFSDKMPGFTQLAIHAVSAAEIPILEQDLRQMPLDVAGIIEIAQEHLNSDCAYDVSCYWDLSVFDAASGKWKVEPQPLEISCYGEDYYDHTWRENGHMQVNFGFEHFFTGHAGLLGFRRESRSPAQSQEEARFLEAMAWPENLERYHDETRKNIRKLLDWIRRIEHAAPVDRLCLWSEGEENFEARIEEILAAR
ncbi:MAG TPA: hypothetical protein VHX36_13400 [Candidatus Acidoferrales bacterium]|nr:hypothetical protein [Candidatus Acidoferrales bacterium]